MLQTDVYPFLLLLELSFENSNFSLIPYELDIDYNTIILLTIFLQKFVKREKTVN